VDTGFSTSQATVPDVSRLKSDAKRTITQHSPQPSATGNISELDKLFARLEPAASSASAQIPTLTSNMSVETLFAALGGNELADSSTPPTTSFGLSTSSAASTGLPLLDSIFASASTPASRPSTRPSTTQPQVTYPPAQLEHVSIYSPRPTTEPLPQILNQDVIYTLLGLPPSRSASAASTAYSSGAISHPSSREGDNEDEGYRRGGSDGYSESSTILDPDAELGEELQSAGTSAGRPLLAAEFEFQGAVSNGHGHLNGTGQRIHGDVTPRPPTNGFITPRSNHSSRFQSASSLPIESQLRHAAPVERELVPFETDSDLWPYPPAHARTADSEHSDSDEIIELDFEDTSALSDMDTFSRVLQNGKKHSKIGGGSVNGSISASSVSENGRGRKKGSKERKAEQIRIREEIENSWDVPGPSRRVQQIHGDVNMISGPTSPSPRPSPVPVQTPPSPSPSPGDVPLVAVTTAVKHVNGMTPKRKEEIRGRGVGVDSDAVRESIVAASSAKSPAPTSMARNEFVREVLTLIHVCCSHS
jgi:hypothetical protein